MSHKKLSAATLLETMVALTISVLLFALVALLFGRLTAGSASVERNRAHELLEAWSSSGSDSAALAGGGYNDATWAREGYTLKQQFIVHDSLPGVLEARFVMYNGQGQLVDEIDKWIISGQSPGGDQIQNE